MISVYYSRIDSFLEESFLQNRMDLLCEQRRDKILRCKNSKDRARSMVGGLLLRYALITAGYDYVNIQFIHNEYGKIEMLDIPDVYVNLSHSGEYAVCVLANQPVGVDIEDSARFWESEKEARLLRIAKRSCTVSEIEKLNAKAGMERVQFFMKLWTRKESYAKAKGVGMQIGFSTLDTLHTGFYKECVINDRYHLCVATLKKQEEVCFLDCTQTIEMIG